MDEELETIRRQRMESLAKKIKGENMAKPIELTDDTFAKNIADNEVMVVDCWAPWCGPCRQIAPVIDEMAQEYDGKIMFGKLNVDENQAVAGQYGIMSIPTLMVFKGGELVDRIVGAMPKAMLAPKIEKHIG